MEYPCVETYQVCRRGEGSGGGGHVRDHAGQEVLGLGQLLGPLRARVRVDYLRAAVGGEGEVGGDEGEGHVRHQGVDLGPNSIEFQQTV